MKGRSTKMPAKETEGSLAKQKNKLDRRWECHRSQGETEEMSDTQIGLLPGEPRMQRGGGETPLGRKTGPQRLERFMALEHMDH